VVAPALDIDLARVCALARAASRVLAPAGRALKDKALHAIAERLRTSLDQPSALADANAEDVAAARAVGLSDALVDRLVLNESRVAAMVSAVHEVAALDDPVGEVVGMKRRPNGLLVGQVRVPLGVIAMIYEARPNVTVDSAALCLKSGNAVLLRGGKEAARSNAVLGGLVREAVVSAGLPGDAVQVLPPLGREETRALVGMAGKIDLVIPRGGEGLIRFVTEHARVPVIQHYKGVCHLYVDAEADLNMAFRLVDNGKLQRPGVCNALECLLVHRSVAPTFLPLLARLIDEKGLEVRGDDETRRHLPRAVAAVPADFGQEFLAKVLAVRVVGDLVEALQHIADFGSNHTEAIVTTRYENAQRFLREVDASCVLVNASTRFNDGGELGLGAEIGISTSKLHAYGPMGLESLTARKWIVYGDGQTR
jgi:glutamate-5-semialdehyde dehydrogenase